MLGTVVALLVMQELVQKAAPAPPPPQSSEAIGKAPAGPAPAPAGCIATPEPGHGGAGGFEWYINNETMRVAGRDFVKYGLPRILSPNEVEYHAAASGGLFYAEAGAGADAEVLYLLTDTASCEFQPYQVDD